MPAATAAGTPDAIDPRPVPVARRFRQAGRFRVQRRRPWPAPLADVIPGRCDCNDVAFRACWRRTRA